MARSWEGMWGLGTSRSRSPNKNQTQITARDSKTSRNEAWIPTSGRGCSLPNDFRRKKLQDIILLFSFHKRQSVGLLSDKPFIFVKGDQQFIERRTIVYFVKGDQQFIFERRSTVYFVKGVQQPVFETISALCNTQFIFFCKNTFLLFVRILLFTKQNVNTSLQKHMSVK